MKVAGHAPQLAQNPPRDQQHGQPARPGSGDRIAHGGIQRIALRDGPVVIERDDLELHRTSVCRVQKDPAYLVRVNETTTVRMNFSGWPFSSTGE